MQASPIPVAAAIFANLVVMRVSFALSMQSSHRCEPVRRLCAKGDQLM
jgi:hypothetical protein